MQITKENINDLNAVVKVKVEEKDYRDQVDKVLQDYRKQAKIPGFRPGKVPLSMIRKMYGKGVKADEVIKKINQSLYEYLQKNEIKILGNPLPKEEDEKKPMDFEHQKEFEFSYELGLSPEFEVKLSDKDKFTYYKIKADEKLINKQVDDLAKRYGKVTEMETSEPHHMLFGEFTELDETGNEKEGGIKHAATVAIEYVEEEEAKKGLVGLKKGDTVIVDPRKVSKGGADTASMLGISKEQVNDIGDQFRFEVKHIYHMLPAELNQELFDKVYGKDAVKSEQEFRERIAKDLEKALEAESDRKLMKDIRERLLEKLKLSLPDEFLKKWLVAANEKITQEQVDKEYELYAEDLKWQLIENEICKEHNIKVTPEEALDRTVELLKQQLAQYGQMDMEESELREHAKKVLEKEQEAKNIYDQLYSEKIFDLFKKTFTLKEKEITFDEFVKLSEEKSKPGLLNRMTNLLKSKA